MLLKSLVLVSRSRWVLFVGVSTFIISMLLYFNTSYITTAHLRWPVLGPPSSKSDLENNDLLYPEAQRQLWRQLQPLLDDNPPHVPIIREDKTAKSVRWDPNDKDAPFMEKIQMDPSHVAEMTRAHGKFVAGMQAQIPRYIPTKSVARKGIVSTAAGYYFPVFLVSLRMLRHTGTTLPVEVFLARDQEYEPEICEKVLPELNAKCVILDDIFSHDNGTHKPTHTISKYQYKIFAILFSSFDEVLFLDADSFPLHDPEPLFKVEPFKSTGMVTWPDFWASSISPLYYNISNQAPVPVSVRPTTESGQLLVSKTSHIQALLLAAYYNYYGPSYYYNLFCQGNAGKGDKDTFIPAATALDLPFYATSEPVCGVGHNKRHPAGEFYIFAMIQHDPIQDYELISQGIWRIKDPSVADPPRPMFLHANTPKWNPKNVFDHVGEYDLTRNVWGDQAPAFADPEDVVTKNGIPEVERQMWDEVKWVACELEHSFTDPEWKARTDICARVHQYFDAVLEPKPSNGTVEYKPPRAVPVVEELYG